MVTATLLNNLGAIGEVVAGAAAGLTFIAVVTGALFRLTWPTSIRWAHAYSLTDNAAPNPTLVLTRGFRTDGSRTSSSCTTTSRSFPGRNV